VQLIFMWNTRNVTAESSTCQRAMHRSRVTLVTVWPTCTIDDFWHYLGIYVTSRQKMKWRLPDRYAQMAPLPPFPLLSSHVVERHDSNSKALVCWKQGENDRKGPKSSPKASEGVPVVR
jgi:hypothetical protein